MPNVTSSVGALKASPLPNGAYLLKEVELTEKGQVSVQLRDQLKILHQQSLYVCFCAS